MSTLEILSDCLEFLLLAHVELIKSYSAENNVMILSDQNFQLPISNLYLESLNESHDSGTDIDTDYQTEPCRQVASTKYHSPLGTSPSMAHTEECIQEWDFEFKHTDNVDTSSIRC